MARHRAQVKPGGGTRRDGRAPLARQRREACWPTTRRWPGCGWSRPCRTVRRSSLRTDD
ncbi:hypothetical protein G5V59_02175 [Nocardioides sp. W3-2-3]|nr:hypothetical protein [Nocardioides convexus]